MDQATTMPAGKWISVSAPGGPAQQIYLDVFDESQASWIRVGTFSDELSAVKHQTDLRLQGVASRLVRHQFCPSAR